MIRLIMIFSLFGTVFFFSCTKNRKVTGEDVLSPDAKPQTFKKIAPMTANVYGSHKNFYERGWKLIPSSKKNLADADKSFRMSYRTAKAMMLVSMKKRAEDYPGELGDTMKSVWSAGKNEEEALYRVSQDIYSGTFELAKWELRTSGEFFGNAWDSFTIGYISLGKTSIKDKEEIFGKMAEYNGHLNGNYKSLAEVFDDTRKSSGERISSAWRGAYRRSILEWDQRYKKSGEASNSLLALWDIFAGYTIALKELALSPLAGSATGAGEFIGGSALVMTGTTANFVGQIAVNTGMTVFYVGKNGYNVLSPTMESGYLGAMGIASAVATVPTVPGGVALGAFNQTAAFAGANTVRVAGTAGGVAYETGATAAGMIYDFGKGTGESVLYGMKSGVVLGYTALSVIPAHLFMGTVDGTVFLVWDGPRLAVAVVRGNFKGFDNLKEGTVVDLEEAKKAGKVEIITDDEKIVKDVLQKEIEARELELKRQEEKEDKK